MQPQENVSTIADPKEKLIALERELNELFLEREEYVRAMLCALLAGEHVLFLGPTGAAKSALSRALTVRLAGGDLNSGDYFYELMRPDTTSEEVFGPYSIRALGNDAHARKTSRYLPQERVAFIDEVPRGNSAVLNGMLPILNEGIFKNDATTYQVPLKLCVGAANTLPTNADDDLAAFYDRWLVRMEVGYVSDANFISLLAKMDPASPPENPAAGITCISEDELETACSSSRMLDATGVYGLLGTMRRSLREKGIEVSDRRFGGCLKLIKAHAYLEGRDRVADEDLLILRHALWEHPVHQKDVRTVVLSTAAPQLGAARNLLDEATELHLAAINAGEEDQIARAQESHAKLKRIKDRLLDLRAEATASGRNPAGIDGILVNIERMIEEILTTCLGLDLRDR